MGRSPTSLFCCWSCAVLLGGALPGRAQLSLPADPDGAKELARAAFEAGQAKPRDLARARLSAARTERQVRYEKYRAGAQDATLDSLLEAVARAAEAELAVLDKPTPAQRREVLATRWQYALSAEQIVEEKYRLGRVSLDDFMQARHARLDAEIKLKAVDEKLSAPFVPPIPLSEDEEAFAPSDAKAVAKSALEAAQTSPRDLAVARRDAAQACYRYRSERPRWACWWAGLGLTQKAARQLLDAELALCETPAERLAAHQRYCEQLRAAEDLMRRKYEVGRIGPGDYVQARSLHQDAELRMRQARDKVNEK